MQVRGKLQAVVGEEEESCRAKEYYVCVVVDELRGKVRRLGHDKRTGLWQTLTR